MEICSSAKPCASQMPMVDLYFADLLLTSAHLKPLSPSSATPRQMVTDESARIIQDGLRMAEKDTQAKRTLTELLILSSLCTPKSYLAPLLTTFFIEASTHNFWVLCITCSTIQFLRSGPDIPGRRILIYRSGRELVSLLCLSVKLRPKLIRALSVERGPIHCRLGTDARCLFPNAKHQSGPLPRAIQIVGRSAELAISLRVAAILEVYASRNPFCWIP